MDYAILEQFVTFYQTGTLRETAERLHISQPTLTRNMQKIEAEFDVPLFIRTKNSIALNETGYIVAEDAQMILKHTDNMLRRARDFNRAQRTILLGTCTPVLIMEIMQKLSVLYPQATVSSETQNIPQLLEGLDNDVYQLILLPFCLEEQHLHAVKWQEEHLFFLLPKQHRFAHRKFLSVSEMNGENMLLFQDIGFWRDLVEEKMPDSRFLVQTERYTFLELVENSTLPSFTTDFYHASLSLATNENRVKIPIADPEFNVTYYLVYKKKNAKKFAGLSEME